MADRPSNPDEAWERSMLKGLDAFFTHEPQRGPSPSTPAPPPGRRKRRHARRAPINPPPISRRCSPLSSGTRILRRIRNRRWSNVFRCPRNASRTSPGLCRSMTPSRANGRCYQRSAKASVARRAMRPGSDRGRKTTLGARDRTSRVRSSRSRPGHGAGRSGRRSPCASMLGKPR